MRVTLVHSPGPRAVREQQLDLPEGSCVADALRACGMAVPAGEEGAVGVWGRKVDPSHLLRERDRVELYRPLLVDPKVARRERFRRQGARAAGLFARKRPGGKPAY